MNRVGITVRQIDKDEQSEFALFCFLGRYYMCCNTKQKIADGVLEVLREKPLRKVTVQDIMDCKNMKRQSFYYHFRDIYDVIDWMFEQDFSGLIDSQEDESFTDWICKVAMVIEEKRWFYRKVVESVSREIVIRMIYPIIKKQIEKEPIYCQNELLEKFVIRSICHFIIDTIESRQKIHRADIREAIGSAFEIGKIAM